MPAPGWNKSQKSPLLAMVREVGFKDLLGMMAGDAWADMGQLKAMALSPDTIHVAAPQLLMEIMTEGESIHLRDDLEDVTPPFPCMWIELLFNKRYRWGALVETAAAPAVEALGSIHQHVADGPYHHLVKMVFFLPGRGCVCPVVCAEFLTDMYGQIAAILKSAQSSGLDCDVEIPMGQWCLLAACEAMTRLNTKGTELVRESDRRSSRRRLLRPLEARACVWHRIVVPKMADQQKPRIAPDAIDCAGSSGAIERRERWVKACRKDYRKGKGLFGRIRELIWVPAHKIGNPDLGTVIPEYELQG